MVPVVEIVALEGNGVDPAYYQRLPSAIAMLHKGRFAREPSCANCCKDRPNDQVIAMCLERLHTADGSPPNEMIFEFDTK